jgi:serine/threonine-protein kinase
VSSPRETVILRPDSPAERVTTPRISTEYQASVVQRLGVFAAVIAGAVTFVLLLEHFLVEVVGWPRPPGFHWNQLTKLGLVGLSAAVVGLAKSGRVRAPTMILLGLIYEVVGAFLIASESWMNQTLIQASPLVISWLCVWIVMFPLMVPTTPTKNIVASFASALMGPIFLSFCVLSGRAPLPSPDKIVSSFIPNFVAAGMAIAPALLLYKMGRSLHAAERKVQELGSYQLVELLGSGGMGEVWRAEHRMLARPAAIKLVRLDDDDATPETRLQFLRRFEIEARATASLHSPHTVSLYDFGTTQEGTFYYVMELLHGLDLESLVSRFGPVPPARAVHILKQACASLAEAHASGLIHRDIKPANLYLCRLGLEHDFVKVLDFGLVARAKGCTSCGKDGEKARLTGANVIVGTPSFMPPEMAEGRPDVDGRADIYSLGCVAYWLLTGTLLFDGPEKTPMKILMDHVGTAPEPLSKRLGRPVPAPLEALVLRCLEKDPRARPPSASELARLFDECALEDNWNENVARRWWEENLTDLAASDNDPSALSSTIVRVEARVA